MCLCFSICLGGGGVVGDTYGADCTAGSAIAGALK